MFKITTTKTSNGTGTGQVVAKGNGKQVTTNWDHAATREDNHRKAAEALAEKLGITQGITIVDDAPKGFVYAPNGR
jgi:hypothetical protein